MQEDQKAKGIMILIEFKDTVGLQNFTNEMEKRNINGLLMVTPEFVKDNCDDIKAVRSFPKKRTMGSTVKIIFTDC